MNMPALKKITGFPGAPGYREALRAQGAGETRRSRGYVLRSFEEWRYACLRHWDGNELLTQEEGWMAEKEQKQRMEERTVEVVSGAASLRGSLSIPEGARSIVFFTNGGGASLYSAQNRSIAEILNRSGFASLSVNLLTPEEEAMDLAARHMRCNIKLLARRISAVSRWLRKERSTRDLGMSYFGANMCAAAAVTAARGHQDDLDTMVLRTCRTDLVDNVLAHLKVPMLFIVGSRDFPLIDINRVSLRSISAEKKLAVIKGATRHFASRRAIIEVAELTSRWMQSHSKQLLTGVGAA